MSTNPNALQRDLKPCPFCGGPATLMQMPRASFWWRVRCDSFQCGGTTWALMGADVAVEAWNRRDGEA